MASRNMVLGKDSDEDFRPKTIALLDSDAVSGASGQMASR